MYLSTGRSQNRLSEVQDVPHGEGFCSLVFFLKVFMVTHQFQGFRPVSVKMEDGHEDRETVYHR